MQRSRSEHTTVHGAISAAFLLALTQQDAKSSDMMRCLHPVNVRPSRFEVLDTRFSDDRCWGMAWRSIFLR
ncbi:MAG: hypothetical protein ACFCUV_16425 [Rivularia sp. (in: cyanobacteria)]